MFAADNPQIQELFNASVRDSNTLSFPVHDEIFGFHAQQAVEKLYKVLITAHGVEHAFTHRLTSLRDHLVRLNESMPGLPIDLDELSAYAVESRYESGKPFSTTEREALRSAIQQLENFVRNRCEVLRQAGVLIQRP
jgi:HEPN domain-containing protein